MTGLLLDFLSELRAFDARASDALLMRLIERTRLDPAADANDVLLRPFATVAQASPSKWMRRSVPALLALLVYGFGFGLLARLATGR